MGYSFIEKAIGPTGSNSSQTSPNKDISGADLIVGFVSGFPGAGTSPTIADSTGVNIYTRDLFYNEAVDVWLAVYTCQAPTTSSSFWFKATLTNLFGVAGFLAFSGSTSSPFDVGNGAILTGSHNSLSTGSISPTAGDLVITGAAMYFEGSDTSVTPSGFTTGLATPGAGGFIGLYFGYLLSASGNYNPNWQWTNSGELAVTVGSYKASGGGATTRRPYGPSVIDPGFHPSHRELIRKPSLRETILINERKAA